MTDEQFDHLWKKLQPVANVDSLDYGAAVTIGSVFAEMKAIIIEQREALEFYADENKYESIKNPDGEREIYVERDGGEKARQALKGET